MLSRQPRITLALLLLATTVAVLPAERQVSDILFAAGRLGIGIDAAHALESKLGQLFIVNVDGFGQSGPLALGAEFAPLLERLQIGGVIPHYASTDFERIRRTNRFLARTTRLPLLLCCDIVKLRGAAETATFGDGYIGGFIGKYRSLGEADFKTLASLNAFVFAAMGINIALGPTVDASTFDLRTKDRARTVAACMRRFGVGPVLKHFPYLPARANLHRESPDTLVSKEEVEKRIGIFRDLRTESDILMTTHLRDSLIDGDIVTFSPRWLALLRGSTSFSGLLMSDGLLMLRNYPDRRLISGWPATAGCGQIDETACWASRAILAGHDFIIVEGSAKQTLRAFEGVLTAACENTDIGKKLRSRIEESYARIYRWKRENERILRRALYVPISTIAEAITMVPVDGADLATFRFDSAALARLAPEMERAAVFPRIPGAAVFPRIPGAAVFPRIPGAAVFPRIPGAAAR